MQQIQNGDEKALALLLDRYASMVFSIGVKVLRDREEAEELVQDIFFKIYRKSRLYDPDRGTVRSWLLNMAYHRAFDRRDYLQIRRFYDSRSVEDVADMVRASTDVEYEARIKQGKTVLRKAFEVLSEKEQLTLSLFFMEGYTLREISQHLQESLANTRHHYYRGLKHLKAGLDERVL